jgi:hypothetical protein
MFFTNNAVNNDAIISKKLLTVTQLIKQRQACLSGLSSSRGQFVNHTRD